MSKGHDKDEQLAHHAVKDDLALESPDSGQDHAAAHRASNAGLHREAHKVVAEADKAPVDPKAQHENADLASLHGVQSLMTLLAGKMMTAKSEIDGAVSAQMNDAGVDPLIDIIDNQVEEVSALSLRLANMSNTIAANSNKGTLSHEIAIVKRAFEGYSTSVMRAKGFAQNHQRDLGRSYQKMIYTQTSINNMITATGHAEADVGMANSDALPTQALGQLEYDAVSYLLSSALENAKSVRAGNHGDFSILRSNLYNAVLELGAVDKKHLKLLKPLFKKLSKELSAIETESADLLKTQGSGTYTSNVATIAAHAH